MPKHNGAAMTAADELGKGAEAREADPRFNEKVEKSNRRRKADLKGDFADQAYSVHRQGGKYSLRRASGNNDPRR